MGLTMLLNRQSVISAVTELVNREHNGNWEFAFVAADQDRDDRINDLELSDVLKRAGYKTSLIRWPIVRAILDEVDTDKDGSISLAEFKAVFQPGVE